MRDIGRPQVCWEGDGGSGGIGSFFSNLFGGATQTAPTTTSLSLGELNPAQISALSDSGGVSAPTGFDVPVGGQDGSAPGGVSIPLTGATPAGATPTPAVPGVTPSSAIPSLEGPGAGTGAIPGPGGGAAAIAAPASLQDPNAITSEALAAPAGSKSISPASSISSLDVARTNMDALARDPGVTPVGAAANSDTSIDKFLADPTGKSLLKALGSNANILLPAAGLAYQATQTQKAPEGLDAIRSAAAQTGAQSALMQQYLTSGTLPAGLQAGLDQAKEAAKASIRARYANLPGSSSAMEAELTNADQTASSQGAQLAIQLFSQGMSEAQVSNQLYEAILQQSLERDKELSGAVGNFATAMAGGGPSLKLSLG